MIDLKSYEEAYIELCIPKLLAPFIRLEMLNWNPLKVYIYFNLIIFRKTAQF